MKRCPSCNARAGAGSKVCPACGHKFGEESPERAETHTMMGMPAVTDALLKGKGKGGAAPRNMTLFGLPAVEEEEEFGDATMKIDASAIEEAVGDPEIAGAWGLAEDSEDDGGRTEVVGGAFLDTFDEARASGFSTTPQNDPRDTGHTVHGVQTADYAPSSDEISEGDDEGPATAALTPDQLKVALGQDDNPDPVERAEPEFEDSPTQAWNPAALDDFKSKFSTNDRKRLLAKIRKKPGSDDAAADDPVRSTAQQPAVEPTTDPEAEKLEEKTLQVGAATVRGQLDEDPEAGPPTAAVAPPPAATLPDAPAPKLKPKPVVAPPPAKPAVVAPPPASALGARSAKTEPSLPDMDAIATAPEKEVPDIEIEIEPVEALEPAAPRGRGRPIQITGQTDRISDAEFGDTDAALVAEGVTIPDSDVPNQHIMDAITGSLDDLGAPAVDGVLDDDDFEDFDDFPEAEIDIVEPISGSFDAGTVEELGEVDSEAEFAFADTGIASAEVLEQVRSEVPFPAETPAPVPVASAATSSPSNAIPTPAPASRSGPIDVFEETAIASLSDAEHEMLVASAAGGAPLGPTADEARSTVPRINLGDAELSVETPRPSSPQVLGTAEVFPQGPPAAAPAPAGFGSGAEPTTTPFERSGEQQTPAAFPGPAPDPTASIDQVRAASLAPPAQAQIQPSPGPDRLTKTVRMLQLLFGLIASLAMGAGAGFTFQIAGALPADPIGLAAFGMVGISALATVLFSVLRISVTQRSLGFIVVAILVAAAVVGPVFAGGGPPDPTQIQQPRNLLPFFGAIVCLIASLFPALGNAAR